MYGYLHIIQKAGGDAGGRCNGANACISAGKPLAQMCILNICATYFNIGSMPPLRSWLILAEERLISVNLNAC